MQTTQLLSELKRRYPDGAKLDTDPENKSTADKFVYTYRASISTDDVEKIIHDVCNDPDKLEQERTLQLLAVLLNLREAIDGETLFTRYFSQYNYRVRDGFVTVFELKRDLADAVEDVLSLGFFWALRKLYNRGPRRYDINIGKEFSVSEVDTVSSLISTGKKMFNTAQVVSGSLSSDM